MTSTEVMIPDPDVDDRSVEQHLVDALLARPSASRWPVVTAPIDAGPTYFALHRAPDIDPVLAVAERIPRLLHRLRIDSDPVQRAYVGRVRGKINWGATIRDRAANNYDPRRFVCREAERRTDTLENQLLSFVLARLADAVESVPTTIRHARCRTGLAGGERFTTNGDQLDALAAGLRRLRLHPLLRTISVPDVITEDHLAAARAQRLPHYHEVVTLYLRWDETVVERSPAGFVACASYALPLPASPAGNERWIELAALALTGVGARPRARLGPIQPAN